MLNIIHEFPNKRQFIHQETQYDCLIIKDTDNTWGVFVGLPPRHQYWKESFERINTEGKYFLNLNYSSFCEHTDEKTGICHIPIKDKKTKVWWVGYKEVNIDEISLEQQLEGLAFSLKALEE